MGTALKGWLHFRISGVRWNDAVSCWEVSIIPQATQTWMNLFFNITFIIVCRAGHICDNPLKYGRNLRVYAFELYT